MSHGLMFHHFFDDRHPQGQGAISAAEFRDILEHVGVDRILPASEWQERSLAGTLRDDAVCLTFDDALRCQMDVAKPVMDSLGLTGFWFVYSAVFEGQIGKLEAYRYFRTLKGVDDFYRSFDAVAANSQWSEEIASRLRTFDAASYMKEYTFFTSADRKFRFLRDDVLGPTRYEFLMDSMLEQEGFDAKSLAPLLWMDDDSLRELERDGNIVGLHSYSHPTAIERDAPDKQHEEYRKNRDHLKSVLRSAPTTVSHPSNSYNATTLEILKSLGVTLGFRADMKFGLSQLEQPREDHSHIMMEMGRR